MENECHASITLPSHRAHGITRDVVCTEARERRGMVIDTQEGHPLMTPIYPLPRDSLLRGEDKITTFCVGNAKLSRR